MRADGIHKTKVRKSKGKGPVTMREYVSFKLAVRGSLPAGDFNPVLNSGKLTQQLIIDYYCQIEGDRLKFICNQQAKLRVDTYIGQCICTTSSGK